MTVRQLNFYVLLFAVAFVVVGPWLLYPVVLMKAMSFAIFAMAFNLSAGYAGMLSFGHAAFFGVAAYVTAFSLKLFGLSPEIAIVLSILSAGLIGLIFGRLTAGSRGIYFAMVTLALSQIIYFVVYKSKMTGGDEGIQGVPRRVLFSIFDLNNPTTMYCFITIVFIAASLFIYRIVYSPFGRVVEVIRQNEPRATSLGYNAERYKLGMFVLSAMLSGLAGSLNCLILTFATVNNVHWSTSGDVILMTLIGGIGTPFGPAIGAFALVFLDQNIASLGSLVTMIRGVIFVICVLAFREGIMGALNKAFVKRPAASSG